jgi:hypothetical protein
LFDRHDEARNDGFGSLDAHFAMLIGSGQATEPVQKTQSLPRRRGLQEGQTASAALLTPPPDRPILARWTEDADDMPGTHDQGAKRLSPSDMLQPRPVSARAGALLLVALIGTVASVSPGCRALSDPAGTACQWGGADPREVESWLRDGLAAGGASLETWSLGFTGATARLEIATSAGGARIDLDLDAACSAPASVRVNGSAGAAREGAWAWTSAGFPGRRVQPGRARDDTGGRRSSLAALADRIASAAGHAPGPDPWIVLAAVAVAGIGAVRRRSARRHPRDGAPPDARPGRAGPWLADAVVVVLIGAAFYATVLPLWSDRCCTVADFVQPLTYAHRVAFQGASPMNPQWWPPLTTADIRLGPLVLLLFSSGLLLTGGDLHATWVLLVSLHAVAIAGSYLALSRLLGRGRALVFAAAMVASPCLYQELTQYFWHHPYSLPFTLAFSTSLLWFQVRRRPIHWHLAIVSFGLALQVHASSGVLLVPLVVVGVSCRRSLTWRTLGTGLALLALTWFHVVFELGSLLDPGWWVANLSSIRRGTEGTRPAGPDAALKFVSSSSRAGLLGPLLGLAIGILRLAPGARRRQTAERTGLAWVLVAWAGGLVLARSLGGQLFHKEYYLYASLPCVPLALVLLADAVVDLLGRIRAGASLAAGVWIGAAGLLAAPLAGDLDLAPREPPFPAADASVARRVVEIATRDAGMTAGEIRCSRRLHGYLGLIDGASDVVSASYWIESVPDAAPGRAPPTVSPDEHASFAFDEEGRLTVRWDVPCLAGGTCERGPGGEPTWVFEPTPACRDRGPHRRYLNGVVLPRQTRDGRCTDRGVGVEAGGAPVGLVVDDAVSSGAPLASVFRTAAPVDLASVERVVVRAGCAGILGDFFESEGRYSGAEWGAVPRPR